MKTEKNLFSQRSAIYQVPESVLTHHSQDSTRITAVVTGLLMGTVLWHSPFGSDKGQQVIWVGSCEGSCKALQSGRGSICAQHPQAGQGPQEDAICPYSQVCMLIRTDVCALRGRRPIGVEKTWARHTVQPRWDGHLQQGHSGDDYKDAEGKLQML